MRAIVPECSVARDPRPIIHRRLAYSAHRRDGGAEARGLGGIVDRSGNQPVLSAAAELLTWYHDGPQALQQGAVAPHHRAPVRPGGFLGVAAAEIKAKLPLGH